MNFWYQEFKFFTSINTLFFLYQEFDFLISENRFWISQIEFLISENDFWYKKMICVFSDIRKSSFSYQKIRPYTLCHFLLFSDIRKYILWYQEISLNSWYQKDFLISKVVFFLNQKILYIYFWYQKMIFWYQ